MPEAPALKGLANFHLQPSQRRPRRDALLRVYGSFVDIVWLNVPFYDKPNCVQKTRDHLK